jgi:hypothetical protein
VSFDRERIVEEHHYAVSCEVLECPFVARDEFAECAVVLAEHVEELLRSGGLGEDGEAPQVAEEDVMYARCPARSCSPSVLEMSSATCGETNRASSVRCRSTASKRRAFRDRDRRLIGEGLDERDVVGGERLRFATHENDDADEIVFDQNRDTEHRPVEARSGIHVLRVLLDVRDMDRFPLESGTARGRRSIEGVRMLPVVLRALRRAVMDSQVEEFVLEEPERPVVGVAKSSAGLDHLLENRLEPRGLSDGS